jgi:hypothetical protein
MTASRSVGEMMGGVEMGRKRKHELKPEEHEIGDGEIYVPIYIAKARLGEYGAGGYERRAERVIIVSGPSRIPVAEIVPFRGPSRPAVPEAEEG